jgi:hypothetical protein
MKILDLPTVNIMDIIASPSGKYLAYEDDIGVNLIDAQSNTIIPVATSKPEWASNILFSGDERYLAYNDAEGLKLFNLINQTSQRVISHVITPHSDWRTHFYYPLLWSPDSQRLIVGVSYYESGDEVLIDFPSETLYNIIDCGGSSTWSLDSTRFILPVNNSEMYGCGDEPGVYQVTVSENSITEKRVYEEVLSSDEPWKYYYYDVSYSPDEKWISFVRSNPNGFQSWLMLTELTGAKSIELEVSREEIFTPLWSADSTRLFYTYLGEESPVISLSIDSGEKVEQYPGCTRHF